MSEPEQLEAKVGRIEPTTVVATTISEVEDGIIALLARRDQIDAEIGALGTEREDIEQTIKDAGKKVTRLRNAQQLLEEAADLAPSLPACELEPTGGGPSVPPTDEPPPASPPTSANGSGTLPATAELQPPTPRAGTVKSRLVDAFAEMPGWRSVAELADHIGTTVGTLSAPLRELAEENRIDAKGATRSRRYRRRETKTPAIQPAKRKARPSSEDKKGAAGRAQEPTDEGRVLSALQGRHLDIAAIAEATGIVIPKLRDMLGAMMRKGDVRLKKGNPPEYYAVL